MYDFALGYWRHGTDDRRVERAFRTPHLDFLVWREALHPGLVEREV